jgi:hypothetical protein
MKNSNHKISLPSVVDMPVELGFALRRLRFVAFKVCLAFFLVLSFVSISKLDSYAATLQEDETNEKADPSKDEELSEAQKLEAEQKKLAERYKLLEEKLFTLHEFEKGSNPIRSKLLQRAFIQSQEKMTATQMKLIVNHLTKAKLKAAVSDQDEVLVHLNALLELLQSEDRGKRVRDDIQRHQEYLKEVERILRIQKGIRGQAEGGVDGKRLVNSENKTADRTKSLSEEIEANEEGEKDEDETESSNNKEPSTDDSNDQSTPGQKSKEQKGKGGKAKPSQGKPGQSESSPSGDQSNQQDSNSENPVHKRIQAAESRMRDAQKKLEQAKRDDAIEAMKEAEREMALAKKELEEILRQLREEEIERTLAMLEGRFRQMLERQVRVFESTQKLDQIASEQRGTDFEIRAGKLSVEQNSIATDAGRALLLLREDGSSVAFPATVDEMHQDMLQIAARLSAAKVGRITIEIEEDVIDTLNYLIEALIKTQMDMERMKQLQMSGQKGGSPGDKPLVDRLAEIKMLKGLQERIYRRHQRYAKFLDDPDDKVGNTDDPELQAALMRLANKQAKLMEIARDIVNEKNK